ncbi:MAG: hypothetical protein K5872_21990 [Rhizobiaceae bacterium]|nr:hypothetical protein [Rhizobiaceae bacterium]MCV0408891.1 hypothetical protein [Rhizobiaceae bacterium]
MTHLTVHRYAFPLREVVEHRLGDAVGDCEGWQIRIEDDEVVVDVIEPLLPDPSQNMRETMQAPSIEPSVDDVTSLASPAEPERKGGPLARKAALLCQDRGFRTFINIEHEQQLADQDAVAVWLRAHLDIASRADLDHNTIAADRFDEIESAYRRWCEGYD